MQDNSPQDAADLERWQGRRPLTAAAGSYTAADIASLRNIKVKKLYRSCGLSWKQFCARHFGSEYYNANQWISALDEFGPPFFQLLAVVRITPWSFRRIANAVNEEGLFYNGGRIPLEADNAAELARAIGQIESSFPPGGARLSEQAAARSSPSQASPGGARACQHRRNGHPAAPKLAPYD